jgi:hypothetical protein
MRHGGEWCARADNRTGRGSPFSPEKNVQAWVLFNKLCAVFNIEQKNRVHPAIINSANQKTMLKPGGLANWGEYEQLGCRR